jgi:hypothetical protein
MPLARMEFLALFEVEEGFGVAFGAAVLADNSDAKPG